MTTVFTQEPRKQLKKVSLKFHTTLQAQVRTQARALTMAANVQRNKRMRIFYLLQYTPFCRNSRTLWRCKQLGTAVFWLYFLCTTIWQLDVTPHHANEFNLVLVPYFAWVVGCSKFVSFLKPVRKWQAKEAYLERGIDFCILPLHYRPPLFFHTWRRQIPT